MTMKPTTAREILALVGLSDMPDFHSLRAHDVAALLEMARAHRYRTTGHNGSKARYFYAYLCRQALIGVPVQGIV